MALLFNFIKKIEHILIFFHYRKLSMYKKQTELMNFLILHIISPINILINLFSVLSPIFTLILLLFTPFKVKCHILKNINATINWNTSVTTSNLCHLPLKFPVPDIPTQYFWLHWFLQKIKSPVCLKHKVYGVVRVPGIIILCPVF